jgi:hypothetical protein
VGASYFKLGDHNAICYVCGFERKASELLLRWDGVYVCKEDWEPRQPQDFVRGVPEEQAPDWTQPEVPPEWAGAIVPPVSNIVVGTPDIYVDGVLQTVGVNYTILLPDGVITFTSPPAANSTIAWTGVWLDNASVSKSYTLFPLYIATGFTTVYSIYGGQ